MAGALTKEQLAYTAELFGVDLATYEQDDAGLPSQAAAGGVAAAPPPQAMAGSGSDGTADAKKRPKGGGWRQVNLLVTALDFDGGPMQNHEILLEFKAPGADKMDMGGAMDGGGLTFSQVWLQPEGIVRVIAISMGKAMIAPEGTADYKLPASGPLKIKAVQQKRDVTVSAKSTAEATQKAGVKGTVGIDYKIVKAEGEVSAEDENKQGKEVSYTYVVTVGMPVFAVTV